MTERAELITNHRQHAKNYAERELAGIKADSPELVAGGLCTISIKTLNLMLQCAWLDGCKRGVEAR